MLSLDEDLDAGRKLTGNPTQAKQGRIANLRFQIVKVRGTLNLKGSPYFRFGNHGCKNKTGRELLKVATGSINLSDVLAKS